MCNTLIHPHCEQVEDLSRDVVQRKEPTGEEKRLDSAFEGQVKQRVLEDAKV